MASYDEIMARARAERDKPRLVPKPAPGAENGGNKPGANQKTAAPVKKPVAKGPAQPSPKAASGVAGPTKKSVGTNLKAQMVPQNSYMPKGSGQQLAERLSEEQELEKGGVRRAQRNK